MNVGELFACLSYGELSNLSIGMDGAGTIRDADQPRIIHYANHALSLLYTRFSHKRDYVTVQVQEDLHRYVLSTDYAVSNQDVGNTNPRYILDNVAEPFDGRLIKVISISRAPDTSLGETEPVNLLINDGVSGTAVKMLSYNELYVKTPVADQELIIEYQANHPKLSAQVDPTETISLVPILEEALPLKIAARLYSSMNGEENAAKATRLNRDYEYICQLAEAEDLLQESFSDRGDGMANRGWT